ncbi:MAG: hypothetical protein AAGD00_00620 [Planctomycetota bacterium]
MRSRTILNVLIGVLAVAALSAGLLRWHQTEDEAARVSQTREAIRLIESELRLRAVTGVAETNARGYAARVDPSWFERLPANAFVDHRHVWLEIAPESHAEYDHPPMRIALDRDTAAFWYNPAKGVVRARVAPGVSDRGAIGLYNELNGTSVATLFDAHWNNTIPVVGTADAGGVETNVR